MTDGFLPAEGWCGEGVAAPVLPSENGGGGGGASRCGDHAVDKDNGEEEIRLQFCFDEDMAGEPTQETPSKRHKCLWKTVRAMHARVSMLHKTEPDSDKLTEAHRRYMEAWTRHSMVFEAEPSGCGQHADFLETN